MRKKVFRIVTLFLICGIFIPQVIFAATAESVKQNISDVNAQIQALDKEIKQYQDQISQTSQQGNTLSNLIKELTLTRSKLLTETNQTEKKITATNMVIGTLSEDIVEKKNSISAGEQALNALMRKLWIADNNSMVEILLAKESFAEASQEYSNIISLNETIRNNVTSIQKEKSRLETTKDQKETEQEKLSKLKQDLINKKLAVDATKSEKDSLLKDTKNKESNYKLLLADRIKKRDAFEKDLENYEDQLKFILNPNLLPSDNGGVLSWPLEKVYVTQLFGKTIAAKRLYVSGSHSGVDFRASIGTEVMSMGNGVVIGTGDTDNYCKGASFGKWVFIRYDNGLSSTFGHLSVISSSAGQKVRTGDIVALSGNTGHSTGPHLHVAVYASQGADVKTVPSLSCNGKTFIMPIAPKDAYLDPMLYLPKLPSAAIKGDTPRD